MISEDLWHKLSDTKILVGGGSKLSDMELLGVKLNMFHPKNYTITWGGSKGMMLSRVTRSGWIDNDDSFQLTSLVSW